jgi:hypothetical protein
VGAGVDHDTAAFAVNSIRQWWLAVGRACYPEAIRLLVTADGGGSNGSRVRLWKRELQKLANELGPGQYPKDIVVSDAEIAAINIKRAEFHGEWNCTISPNHHPPNRAFIS